MNEDEPSSEAGRGVGEKEATGGLARGRRIADDELADRIAGRIDLAIRRNVPYEIAIVVILIVMAGVGIYLLLSGASERRWELLASGSSCALAVGWPVAKLLRMREINVVLQVLPEILRMATTKDQQDLVIQLAVKLIDEL